MNEPTAADADRRSPLLRSDWQYVEATSIEAFRAADWEILDRQRTQYYAEEQARQVLRMLCASRDHTSFGYAVNNYRHCLQSATLAMRDGLGDEDVVVALLHDIGFVACPESHGEFAAALLGAYVSERNVWMLRHHAIFQDFHCPELARVEHNARDRWRGQPHFEWTARFVARYDATAIDPDYDSAPIEVFEPLVKRIFARAPRQQSE